MKKNQERRLHRKNAKIVKEGGTPLQLNRQIKPDTTVNDCDPVFSFYSYGDVSVVVDIVVKWAT